MTAQPGHWPRHKDEGLLIRGQGLTKTHRHGQGAVTALASVDVSAAAGECVLLLGPSGSGKSTLLSLLAGLDRADEGSLTVAGRDMNAISEAELTLFRLHCVGMVFQTPNLLPTLSALENAALPARLAGQSRKEALARASALLHRLGLSQRGSHLPEELSGGEAQRVAIARALINEPPVILADEPTGNLDTKNGRAVMELLASLAQGGRTVLIATHGDQADDLASRRICLRDGRLAEDACRT